MRDAAFSTPAAGRRERQERFARELRCLRAAAGNPPFRAMAAASGAVSHTTLHEAAKGTRFPSWPTTRAFVEVCGGDVAGWRERWYAAFGAGDPDERAAVDLVEGDVEQGERLQEAEGATGGRARRYLVVGAVCAGLLIAGLSALYVRQAHGGHPRPHAATAGQAPRTGPLIAGDRSTFVADVTVPDGTVVRPGRRFVKTWEFANSGSVPWRGRYLQRAALPADNGTCSTPGKVRVPDTDPGRRVRVSVPVVAPDRPGSCWVGWKMVDGRGRPFLPTARPVYFVVSVAR